jgi:hypothetical protein
MRSLAVVLTLLLAPAALAVEPIQSTSRGYLWKQGSQWIRFEKGRWSAGIDGHGSVSWQTFLWHDQFIYETASGGSVKFGPALARNGSLVVQGVFSARNNSAPMQYAFQVKPLADGIAVHCEFQKSGPLVLAGGGIWLHIIGDRQTLGGSEKVWLEPTISGTLATNVHGTAHRLHLGLGGGHAVLFGDAGLHECSKDADSKNYIYKFNLVREDFNVGRKVAAEYQVRFADLPATFPGEIKPVRQPLAIGRVAPSAAKVPQYGRLELAVDVAAGYDNPFDPDQVRLDAEFTSPSGKRVSVPGFFMVDFRREVQEQSELLAPQGSGGWKVRFTPREVGPYTWQLTLADRSGKTSGGQGQFVATAAETPGFVGRSPVDPHYLAFNNGQGYFPIGHNLPTYHTSGQLGDEAMRKFAAAKENYNRWWLTSDSLGIEWMEHLGWYRQDAAARLDLVLDEAVKLGLRYMLCLDTHQDFRERGWLRNPFNAANGGPCAKPADWFTDATAKNYYKKRLRYTVARWGYSPNVLCWEFGNEIEGWDHSPDAIKLPWTKEMAAYLRGLDPFGHLITTSFWTNTGPEDYWKLPELDIVQTHLYTNNDAGVADQVRDCCLHQWQRFQKPHIFGEFGIRAGAGTPEKDPRGWAIHNGLWAGLFSFAAGGPMPWWHESYLDKLDLYFHFTALANFTAGLPLGTARWSPVQIEPPKYLDKHRKPGLRDAIVVPVGAGFTRPEHNEFQLLPDGSLADGLVPGPLLHGDGHRDLRNPPTFVVNYPRKGKFIVRVGRVSRMGRLAIWIDDRQVLDRPLPCGEGLGTEGRYVAVYKLWETVYDQDIAVAVPAGRHRIRVDNLGRDWVTVSRYAFTNCKVLDRPNAIVWGMATEDLLLVWLQNRDSTWYNHAGGGEVGQVDAFGFQLDGVPNGRYRLEWWQTWTGGIHHEGQAEVTDGHMAIEVPPLKTDVAIKIRREK